MILNLSSKRDRMDAEKMWDRAGRVRTNPIRDDTLRKAWLPS